MRTIVDLSLNEIIAVQALRLLPETEQRLVMERVFNETADAPDANNYLLLTFDEMRLVQRLRTIQPELRADAAEYMYSASYRVQPLGYNEPRPEREKPSDDKPLDNAAEQFGYFILAYLALLGMVSPNVAADPDDIWVRSLVEALDIAAQRYDAIGYENFNEICHHAEFGRRWDYEPGEGSRRDYVDID